MHNKIDFLIWGILNIEEEAAGLLDGWFVAKAEA